MSYVDPSKQIKKWEITKLDSIMDVEVYMEALCPDVHDFILKQLKPTFEKSSQILNVTLIPFGKASVSLFKKRFPYTFRC